MRRIITIAIGVVMYVLVGASAGLAQSVPQGSYQQTCTNIGARGGVLTATCKDVNGEWRDAQLRDANYCNSDITNENGELRCSGGYQGGYDGNYGSGYYEGNIPSGSYSQTCQNVHIEGNDLEARCPTVNGYWRTTRLRNFDRCGGDISNNDGRLTCTGYGYGNRRRDDDDDDYDRGSGGGYYGGGSGLPSGSYVQTCRNIRRHGDTLEAVCRSRDGDWHQTTLNDYHDCRGQIVNDGGNLRCNSNYDNVGGWYGGSYRGGFPSGSYTQTCQNIRVEGDELKASCQKGNGGWRTAELDDYQACRNDIVNDNGRLRCAR